MIRKVIKPWQLGYPFDALDSSSDVFGGLTVSFNFTKRDRFDSYVRIKTCWVFAGDWSASCEVFGY